jgi:hypothetical protein
LKDAGLALFSQATWGALLWKEKRDPGEGLPSKKKAFGRKRIGNLLHGPRDDRSFEIRTGGFQ